MNASKATVAMEMLHVAMSQALITALAIRPLPAMDGTAQVGDILRCVVRQFAVTQSERCLFDKWRVFSNNKDLISFALFGSTLINTLRTLLSKNIKLVCYFAYGLCLLGKHKQLWWF